MVLNDIASMNAGGHYYPTVNKEMGWLEGNNNFCNDYEEVHGARSRQ